MNLSITDNPNASKDNKRLLAIFYDTADGKTKSVKFGMYNSAGTYLDTGDDNKKKNYIARHSKLNENWTNIMSAGGLSRWILWEYTDINNIKKLLNKKFNINHININITKY